MKAAGFVPREFMIYAPCSQKKGRKYTRLTCRPLFADDKQKCTKKTTTTMTHFTFQWGTGQRKESHWNVLASTIFGGTQGGTRKQGQACSVTILPVLTESMGGWVC